jgi:EKC/KEOPS complex subunit CGI121/TPRKB
VVIGTPVEFSDNTLSEMTDIARVKKNYKLNTSQNVSPSKRIDAQANGIDGIKLGERKELETAIIGAMALRGAS